MEFFNQAIDILKILVMALGAGLAVWGVINLLEGYGWITPAAKPQGHNNPRGGGGGVASTPPPPPPPPPPLSL